MEDLKRVERLPLIDILELGGSRELADPQITGCYVALLAIRTADRLISLERELANLRENIRAGGHIRGDSS